MYRIAIISLHGCPVARLGEKDTGGMNVYVLQTAKELGQLGHKVDVYTRYHDPADPQVVKLNDNARVIHLQAGPYDEHKEQLHLHIPQFLSNLYRFQEGEGLSYDLVHSHYWLSGMAGIPLSQRWHIPHVTQFHTLAEIKRRARVGQVEPSVRIEGEKSVMSAANAIIASSRFETEDIVHLYGVSPHKVHVIPPGVDLALFQPMNRTAARERLNLNGNKIVLYVGRVEPIKGLGILLEAISLVDPCEHVQLLVVGGNAEKDAELVQLQLLSEKLLIQGKVDFLGTVNHDELPVYYNAADVFVMPSYYESFGLAALEAMACGTPVIASRVGGLQTIVKDGETGYLISWQCPEPFTQRLEMLLSNQAVRQSMAVAARTKAQEMGWSRVVERLLELYHSLTKIPLATS
ncbi:MAG: glycosyltransferase [Chloroflexi bacterium]|nr:glycosyltransferase [Chloroflexota bacterium]